MEHRDRTRGLEESAHVLERAARGLRTYRGLVGTTLGETPEEVRLSLEAHRGLTPAQVREILMEYKATHPGETQASRVLVPE